jgi:hypothetical protein
LGHYEEEKKKLSHRIAFDTIFFFKTGKKGENITQESAFKVFSCGGGRGGGVRGGWFRVLQKYSMYFFIFGVCPKNRHALIYPTPHKPIYVAAREVDRWLQNTPC